LTAFSQQPHVLLQHQRTPLLRVIAAIKSQPLA